MSLLMTNPGYRLLHMPFTVSQFARGGSFLLAALILMMPALLNGFPFVLEDSMDYVALTPVLYRSTFYSLFVNATDLQLSPWLPIFAQALLVTYLMSLWLRIAIGRRETVLLPLLAVLLTLGTSAGYVTGYLMPDIFTALLMLSAALLMFAQEKISSRERVFLSLLVGLSVSVHLSHLPILAMTLFVIGVVLLATGETALGILRRFLPVVEPAAIATALLFVSHAVLFGIAKLSPAGPVFFLASLIGNGPAADYLREACPEAQYRICAEVENLPSDSNTFLWGGMLYKLGWFEAYRAEAETIVNETIKTRPLAVAGMAVRAFGSALLTHAPAEDFRPLGWNMWRVEAALAKYGPETVERFRDSAQIRETIPKPLIRVVDAAVLPFSLLALAAFLWKSRAAERPLAWMSFAVLTGVLANVFVCAFFSGVFDRYQTRVSWLIPFLALLFAIVRARRAAAAAHSVNAVEAA